MRDQMKSSRSPNAQPSHPSREPVRGRRRALTALGVACLSAATRAHGQLTIEIVGGGANQIPITVLPFGEEDAFSQHISEIVSADLNRSGRFKLQDIGNVIEAEGMSITIPSDMILSVPVGTPSAAPVTRKAARIWWHTQSKVTRKCTDAQAAATFATSGKTSETVTDRFFTEYGFPWARIAERRPDDACSSVRLVYRVQTT